MVGYGAGLASRSVPEWRVKYLRYDQLASLLKKLPQRKHDDDKVDDNLSTAEDEDPVKKIFAANNVKFSKDESSGEFLDLLKLSCVPVTTEIETTLKHAGNISATVGLWEVRWDDSDDEHVPITEKEFFSVLNADTRMIVEFQFKIFCQCLAELTNLDQHANSLIESQNADHTSDKELHSFRETVGSRARTSIEAEILLKGYEQLFKLINLLKGYMQDNKTGMEKILKKLSKHSVFSNCKTILKPILTGQPFPKVNESALGDTSKRVLPGTNSEGPAESKPCTPAVFDLARVDVELVKAVEKSYCRVKTFKKSDLSQSEALAMLRHNSAIHKQQLLHPRLFFSGLFLGISIPLTFYTLSVIIGDNDIHASYHWKLGWIQIRLCFLITWQFFLWGVNLYLFDRLRINHVLIFDLRGGADLQYDSMFSIATFFFVTVFSGFTLFVKSISGSLYPSDCDHDTFKWMESPETDMVLWPRLLATFVLGMLLCPLPLNFYKTRRWMLMQIWRMATVPFREVDWPMFFLADQLCSHVRTIKDFAITAFYLLVIRDQRGMVEWLSQPNHNILDLTAGLLPLTIRVIQCGRRYYDMKRSSPQARNPHHLNALKYVSSMFVVIFSAYGLTSLWIASAIVATAYAFYWDVIMDWGLGDAKHGYLRKELLLSSKRLGGGIYYAAIVLDLGMRCAWVLSISPGALGIRLRNDILVFALAALELARRAMWNVFRLENEQFHNTGEWRAVKHLDVELSHSILLSPTVLISSTFAAFRSRLMSSPGASDHTFVHQTRTLPDPSLPGPSARQSSPLGFLGLRGKLSQMRRPAGPAGSKSRGGEGDNDGIPMLAAAAEEGEFSTAGEPKGNGAGVHAIGERRSSWS